MQPMIKLIETVFKNNAPLESVILWEFSTEEHEGKQVLKPLAESGISTVSTLDLRSLTPWL